MYERNINGEKYSLVDVHHTKSKAKTGADRFRNKGWNARIVKGKFYSDKVAFGIFVSEHRRKK